MRRRTPVAPLAEMPGLDNHLCFALYAAGNHMTRIFVPFLEKLGVTYPQYLVLVECADEAAQLALLERFQGEGLECRALVS